MIFSKKFVILSLLSASTSAFASDIKGRSSVFTHPFQLKSSGLNFTARNANTENLMDQGADSLTRGGLDSRYHLRQKLYSELNVYSDRKIETVSFGFDLDDVPVCDLEVKVHRTMDGLTTMIGDMPLAPSGVFTRDQWATDAALTKIVRETLMMGSLGSEYIALSKERCLWSQDGLKPAWKVNLKTAAGMNYEIIASGEEVFRFDPKHFHETEEGTATVFKTNINEGEAEAIPLREMANSGYLSNPYFEVCVPTSANKPVCNPNEGTSAYSFAQESTFVYNYDRSIDPNRFTQASIFAHTNVALSWLQTHGYANFGTTQIKLLAHAKVNGDVNNALYQPAIGSETPMILVGDGDGDALQNLGTDADVVSHELGHHVVYNTVTQISGESLVIHEALADFFTFARTGNACLGESICTDTPLGLKVCAKPKACLRSAENDYAYGDANLPTQAHLRGQFISGLLWDLHAKDGIPQDEVTTMVLKGVDLLVSNSGYKHLVVALLLVDHTEYADKYCPLILERAKVRGLTSQLADVSCEAIQTQSVDKSKVTTYLSTTPSGSGDAALTATKKSSKKSCGALDGGLAGSGQAESLLLILSLPIAITWIRRKKS
ncbi:MAG: hypothetical protein H7249_17555 [Chitinophagaceae bacterium]|nr:hypothetical protein [Oligoflexus sp.]